VQVVTKQQSERNFLFGQESERNFILKNK